MWFESEHFKKQAGLLTFTPRISEWVSQTNVLNAAMEINKIAEKTKIKGMGVAGLTALNLALPVYGFKNYKI